MNDIKPYKDKGLLRKKRQRGLLYALLLVILLVVALFSIYLLQHDKLHQERVRAENSELLEMERIIQKELFLVSSDLSYFAQSRLSRAVLKDNNPQAKEYLTDLMLQISAIQKRFDQIRLLDKTGQEVIRINYNANHSPTIVKESELQNKSERYYFSETIKLSSKQIYTSPFDLNIENGEIEHPIKPVIRFAIPIHDADGVLLGVGVVNYLGNRLFDQLKEIRNHPHDPFFLLNEDGFCLKGQNPDEDWSFILNKDWPPSFPNEHPKVWQAIQYNQKGDLAERQGHYFFSHINLAPPPFYIVNDQPLILILHIPRHSLYGDEAPLVFSLSLIFVFLAPLMIFLGWKIGTYQVHQHHMFNVLEYEASHDPLTGLYNRKAILDILKRSMSLATRREAPLALGYLDINDLKKLNDEVGHDAGDRMITGAAQAMTETIRDSDSAARVGGDEFLIIFPDCTKENAAIVLEQIKLNFASQGLKKTGSKWQISIGCTELHHTSDSMDSIIDRADKMMYAHKNLCKSKGDGAVE